MALSEVTLYIISPLTTKDLLSNEHMAVLLYSMAGCLSVHDERAHGSIYSTSGKQQQCPLGNYPGIIKATPSYHKTNPTDDVSLFNNPPSHHSTPCVVVVYSSPKING